MNFDLSVIYLLLLFIVVLVSECEPAHTRKFNCRKIKGSDKKNVINICPAPKIRKDEVCHLHDTWIVITVNPTLSKDEARRLQIVWLVPELKQGDIIRLYKNSRFHHRKKLVFEVVPYSHYGISETRISEQFTNTALKFKPICMDYYVVYFRGSKELASSCLQTNPTWMELYKFGSMRLSDMFIPGTHDSAAYHTSYTPQDIGKLDNYVFTQEESILEQLLHGARALDLRVGKEGNIYYAHHGVAQLYPFQQVLNNITIFLDRTKEVLILDFHDFPVGFNDVKDHLEFINHIYIQFGPYMASPELGWTATLNEIWDKGKHLIVSYNHPEAYEIRKDILWPPITQMWGNVQHVPELYDYLTSTFQSPPEGMWSAQSELTAKAMDIAGNTLGGLRKMASDANTLVSKWYRGDWGKQCRIVAMDFIRSSSIVDIAIEWNLRKSYKKICKVDKEEIERQKKEEETKKKEEEAKKKEGVGRKNKEEGSEERKEGEGKRNIEEIDIDYSSQE